MFWKRLWTWLMTDSVNKPCSVSCGLCAEKEVTHIKTVTVRLLHFIGMGTDITAISYVCVWYRDKGINRGALAIWPTVNWSSVYWDLSTSQPISRAVNTVVGEFVAVCWVVNSRGVSGCVLRNTIGSNNSIICDIQNAEIFIILIYVKVGSYIV
jgi:hypothetical protein